MNKCGDCVYYLDCDECTLTEDKVFEDTTACDYFIKYEEA